MSAPSRPASEMSPEQRGALQGKPCPAREGARHQSPRPQRQAPRRDGISSAAIRVPRGQVPRPGGWSLGSKTVAPTRGICRWSHRGVRGKLLAMTASIFTGTLPALMTPCKEDRTPDFDALVRKAQQLMGHGMTAAIYAGSMGDWPLLTDAQRMEGVERLVEAGIPVIAGTGAVNTRSAVALAEHAQRVGAKGLMVIPRVLSRGSVLSAQKAHFSAILSAAPELEAVIYNSPYYGFATRADLFFELRKEHPNLVGFKEFGSNEDLTYAAENITSASDDNVLLAVGVDTSVVHGYVN